MDNSASDILVNGVSTGNVNNAGFADWTDFTIDGSITPFLPGVNTLTFVTANAPPFGPTGVRFEFLSATAEAVPEPATLGLAAVAAFAGLSARRRRTV